MGSLLSRRHLVWVSAIRVGAPHKMAVLTSALVDQLLGNWLVSKKAPDGDFFFLGSGYNHLLFVALLKICMVFCWVDRSNLLWCSSHSVF